MNIVDLLALAPFYLRTVLEVRHFADTISPPLPPSLPPFFHALKIIDLLALAPFYLRTVLEVRRRERGREGGRAWYCFFSKHTLTHHSSLSSFLPSLPSPPSENLPLRPRVGGAAGLSSSPRVPHRALLYAHGGLNCRCGQEWGQAAFYAYGPYLGF